MPRYRTRCRGGAIIPRLDDAGPGRPRRARGLQHVSVDLRDIRELKRDGTIAGSMHIPRGMLEFWLDPESPYYKSELNDTEEVILFCNGGWRSALAAASLKAMGIENVAHMTGGFGGWQKEIGKTTELSTSKK